MMMKNKTKMPKPKLNQVEPTEILKIQAYLKNNIKVPCKIKPTKQWKIATLNLCGGRAKGKYKHWWNTHNGNGER